MNSLIINNKLANATSKPIEFVKTSYPFKERPNNEKDY